MQLLNGIGDVIDLIKALDKASRPDYFKMSTEELKQEVYRQGHCSALIKVTLFSLLLCHIHLIMILAEAVK